MNKVLVSVLTVYKDEVLEEFIRRYSFIPDFADFKIYVNGAKSKKLVNHDRVEIIELAENTGSAGGFSKILKDFLEADYTHILLLEDDVATSRLGIEKLINTTNKNDVVRLKNAYLPDETFSYHCSRYTRHIISCVPLPNKLFFQGADDAIFEKEIRAQVAKNGDYICVIEEEYYHPVAKAKLKPASVLRSQRNLSVNCILNRQASKLIFNDLISLIYISVTCSPFINLLEVIDLIRWHCFSYNESTYKTPNYFACKKIGDALERYLIPVVGSFKSDQVLQSPNQIKGIFARFKQDQVYVHNLGVEGVTPKYYKLKIPYRLIFRSIPALFIGGFVLMVYRLMSLILEKIETENPPINT